LPLVSVGEEVFGAFDELLGAVERNSLELREREARVFISAVLVRCGFVLQKKLRRDFQKLAHRPIGHRCGSMPCGDILRRQILQRNPRRTADSPLADIRSEQVDRRFVEIERAVAGQDEAAGRDGLQHPLMQRGVDAPV